MKKYLPIVFVLFFGFTALAQHIDNPIPYFSSSKGLNITPHDSSFSLNLRFRMQNRFGMSTVSDKDLSTHEWEAVVRRLRLRLDGFVYNPKFTYVIQLSFSRGDMDWDNTSFPNVIRDAMAFYRPNKNLQFGLGQSKLPGNRQRLVSSGDLQMPDRSNFNSVFQVDRDYGFNVYYNNNIGKVYYSARGAITGGNGRNIEKTDALAYSGRVEVYPFGNFTNGGDYFEGDLEREKKPKLALAGAFSYNENATRTGGSIGKVLYEPRDIRSTFLDFVFKYKGWAWSSELAQRYTGSPITKDTSGNSAYVFSGNGFNSDLSYVFKNKFSIVGRYTVLHPLGDTKLKEAKTDYYALGVGKYLKGHRLKLQTDVTYKNVVDAPAKNNWSIRFQVEMGI